MNYLQIRDLAQSGELRGIITTACGIAFGAIRAEDPGTTYHAKRMQVVAQGPTTTADKMLFDVAMNSTIQSKASQILDPSGPMDSDVQYLVNSWLSIESYLDGLLES